MNIAVIGAGITGIGAAWKLATNGHAVTLYEKDNAIGGLARCMKLDGKMVERYYHFIMTADTQLMEMIEAMGVRDQLNWVETETQFFANGTMYRFTSPMDLLKFGALGFADRLRFIATMAYLTKAPSSWKAMENRLACEFLPRWGGRRAWDVIFKPMLNMKFGALTDKMSMAWMWARSRMVNQYRDKGVARERRAWVKGSLQTLLDACERWFAANGVTVKCGAAPERILLENGRATGVREADGTERRFDRVLYCAPSHALGAMLPEARGPYFDRIHQQRYFGVTCVVMALKKPLSDYFWTYVSDPRAPFVGVIDYASFTRCDGDSGQNVIYIPYYSLPDTAPYTTPEDTIIADYTRAMKIVFPGFDETQIREVRVIRDPCASIVCDGRYSERMVGLKTPVPGLFFANLSQIYPQDRGLSVGLKLANYAVEAIEKDADIPMDFAPY